MRTAICLIAIVAMSLLSTVRLQAEDAPLDVAMGAKIYAENCTRCHEAPDPASRDGRAWRAVSLHMRLFADLSGPDQHQVLAFLRTANTAAIKKPEAATPAATDAK